MAKNQTKKPREKTMKELTPSAVRILHENCFNRSKDGGKVSVSVLGDSIYVYSETALKEHEAQIIKFLKELNRCHIKAGEVYTLSLGGLVKPEATKHLLRLGKAIKRVCENSDHSFDINITD